MNLSEPHKFKNRGFSLVELLVVVAIFIIITSVILWNQNKYSSNAAIDNLAFQIALSIRQAQVYGLSVRQANSSASFDTAFGIQFDCADPTHFVLFSDQDKDGIYDGGDIEVSKYNLENKNTISQISFSTGNLTCNNQSNLKSFITFKRPNPEAIIKNNIQGAQQNYTNITVTSALKDRSRVIVVTQSGQIYVQ